MWTRLLVRCKGFEEGNSFFSGTDKSLGLRIKFHFRVLMKLMKRFSESADSCKTRNKFQGWGFFFVGLWCKICSIVWKQTQGTYSYLAVIEINDTGIVLTFFSFDKCVFAWLPSERVSVAWNAEVPVRRCLRSPDVLIEYCPGSPQYRIPNYVA